ncbi:MAG: hypothetical protein GF397_00475 [Elusimicrobia bacterium]|nr:hypothetical protein [Elusimicrobiota bacterium]
MSNQTENDEGRGWRMLKNLNSTIVARNIRFSISELSRILQAIENNHMMPNQEFDRQLKDVEANVILVRQMLRQKEVVK